MDVFMTTKYKPNTWWPRKVLFWSYTTVVNGTSIGWMAAGTIALQTALDVDAEDVVRKGSLAIASTCIPGSVVLTWVDTADKYYHFGRTVLGHGTKLYKIGKFCTAPMAAVNSVGVKMLTKTGFTEVMKTICNVEKCDDFYWDKPQSYPANL